MFTVDVYITTLAQSHVPHLGVKGEANHVRTFQTEMADKQQLSISENAEAGSGAVASVLSKLNARAAEKGSEDSSDDFEQLARPPKPRKMKKDKGKYVRTSYSPYKIHTYLDQS